jgi:rhodanese-related sulfurtransferase
LTARKPRRTISEEGPGDGDDDRRRGGQVGRSCTDLQEGTQDDNQAWIFFASRDEQDAMSTAALISHFPRACLLAVAAVLAVSACDRPGPYTPEGAMVESPEFDRELRGLLRFTVPVISVDDLRAVRDVVVLLDTRSRAEFDVSRIAGARFVGYDEFDPEAIRDVPPDAMVVLYCSVGHRSEEIGRRLEGLGYSDVHNLYGSIFEWVNRGYPVVDAEGKHVDKLHTYDAQWSRWVTNDAIAKTW